MQCTINGYLFSLDDSGLKINVAQVKNLIPVTTITLKNKLSTQKEFEAECSFWFMKN